MFQFTFLFAFLVCSKMTIMRNIFVHEGDIITKHYSSSIAKPYCAACSCLPSILSFCVSVVASSSLNGLFHSLTNIFTIVELWTMIVNFFLYFWIIFFTAWTFISQVWLVSLSNTSCKDKLSKIYGTINICVKKIQIWTSLTWLNLLTGRPSWANFWNFQSCLKKQYSLQKWSKDTRK